VPSLPRGRLRSFHTAESCKPEGTLLIDISY
jgi:hypothetical protein